MKIAVLDTYPSVSEVFKAILETFRYKVTLYHEPSSFLDDLSSMVQKNMPVPYNLLILDVHPLEELTSSHPYRVIRGLIPEERLPILLTCAAARSDLIRLKWNFAEVPFLEKPFRIEDLLKIVEATGRNERMSLPAEKKMINSASIVKRK